MTIAPSAPTSVSRSSGFVHGVSRSSTTCQPAGTGAVMPARSTLPPGEASVTAIRAATTIRSFYARATTSGPGARGAGSRVCLGAADAEHDELVAFGCAAQRTFEVSQAAAEVVRASLQRTVEVRDQRAFALLN